MQTVLVIDDDYFFLATVSDILIRAGYQVKIAKTPDEAFQLELSGISAILCDYNMPGMNGADLLMAMREMQACQVPFIFLTGHSEMDDLIPTAIRYNAEMLPKPVEPTELLRLLKKQLAPAA